MTPTEQDKELREQWYLKLDDYIYWINRYSQRNQRKEREAKIHQLVDEIIAQGYIITEVKRMARLHNER